MVPLVTIPVTDPDDVRLDDYRRLQDHTLRRQVEDAGGFFMVEGWEAVRRLLATAVPAGSPTAVADRAGDPGSESAWQVRSVLVTEEKAHRLEGLEGQVSSFPHYVASRDVVSEAVGFDLHRGVIASVVRPEPADWRQVAAAGSRLAVLEGINDHENLGAIFRSAAALGVDGVLMAPSVPDPLYRRSVRVSMGAVLMIPFAWVGSWPGDLSGLKEIGFTVVALTPDPSAQLIELLPTPDRVAVLLGAEGEGLTGPALAAADRRVRIGQSRALDSLNVGHAAAIAFHYFGRV